MTESPSEDYPVAVRGVLVRWTIVLGVVAIVALWATWRMGTVAARLPARAASGVAPASEPSIEYWTCTMHPHVRLSGPGLCPEAGCGMKLVPKYAGSDEPGMPPKTPAVSKPAQEAAWYRCTMPECGDVGSADPNSRCPVCGMKREPVAVEDGAVEVAETEIVLGERARRLAELATEPVAQRRLFKRIRTVGKVTYDETRHRIVSAWMGGRIDRLYADFTGMVVQKGDHLVELYSPDLIAAQEELLQAHRAYETIRESAGDVARRGAAELAASAERKLELLGITREQIETIKRTGEVTAHLVIHAPLGGTIVNRLAMEGRYVKTGDVLYEIADLTHVWLLIDLYESDLPWVQPFQDVRVTADALPGEAFHGTIVFVDPVVDRVTRTIKVRVNVDNPRRRLKPEMFVSAEIQVAVGEGGYAVAPRVRGAYACPMHPWETADAPAACGICEMDMVPVETVPGYVAGGQPAELVSVPREAIMQTGERALAYIETQPGVYRGVAVTVGPIAEDETGRQYYPVLGGLEVGQAVVTRGNFVIDSQMQIAGKPSLFHARGMASAGMPGHDAHAGHNSHEAHAPTEMPQAPAADTAEQTLCPVMGGPIDPKVFIEYKGVKVFFCCPGCDKQFLADPEKYLPNLPKGVRDRIAGAKGTSPAVTRPQSSMPGMGGHAHD